MKLTVACYISLLRIVLTPLIVMLMVHAMWQLAFVVFVCAILTDILDGYVARTFNQQSLCGQLLDPLADKILLTSVMLALLFLMPGSWYLSYAVWFLLCKEFVLLVGAAVVWLKYQIFIKPSFLSRFVCFCEVALIALLFVLKVFHINISECFIIDIILLNIIVSVWLLFRYAWLLVYKK